MALTWKYFSIFVTFLIVNIITTQCAIVFRRSPTDTVVTQGGSASLHCTAEDTETSGVIQIGWKKDNNFIVTGSHYLLFQNGTLYISQTRLGDQGEYVCVANIIGQGITAETPPARIYFAFLDPVFYHPLSLSVEDGQAYPAYFQCVSGDSQPSVTISWEKDGLPYSGTSYQTDFGGPGSLKVSGTLQIDNVNEDSQGQYRCVTVNPMLPDQPMRSNYAMLSVTPRQGPPYVKVAPENTTVGIGNSATLDCTIVGTPNPTITWTKLGENGPIRNTLNRYILNNGGLYFANVALSDEGAYVCTGSNSEGTVSTNPIYLKTATMMSSLLQEPSDVFVVLGNSATLTCRPPFSIPPATVSWYKNNVLMDTETSPGIKQLDNGDLQFAAVTLPDAGQYFCAATNSYVPRTVTSRTATVSVQVGALITVPPENIKVVIHDPAVFRCIANGDPRPSITWFKDQVIIDSNYYDPRYTIGNSGASLSISDVIYVDQGTYVCEARNNGNIDRASAFLDVIVPPQIVREPSAEVTARVSTSILLYCEVIGDPTPIITWYKEDIQIVDESGHYLVTSQGLQIIDIAMEDAGSYRCKAENEAGVDEATGVLKVEDLPAILQGPMNQTVNEGSTAIMTCQAAAFPEPTYSWQYEDGILPSQATVSQDGRTLTLAGAIDVNSGKYTCIVANQHGFDDASAWLSVRVAPSVSPISDVTIDQGNELSVQCLVDGKPSPSVQWMKGDYQLTANTRITFPSQNILQINPVINTDEGEYHCVAQNLAGSVRVSFQVTVADSSMITSETVLPASLATTPSITTSIPSTVKAPVHISTASRVTHHSTIAMTSSHSILTSQSTVVTGTHNTVMSVSQSKTTTSMGTSTLLSLSTQKVTTVEPVLEAAPIVISAVPTSSSQVTLSWVPSTIMDTILFYVIQYKLRFATAWQTYIDNVEYRGGTQSYQLSGLQPNTQYLFRVLAKNQYGLGEASNALSATTLSDRKGPSEPRNLQIIGVNSTSVHLQWEIPQDRDGDIASYQVEYMQEGNTGNILDLGSSGLFVATAIISNLLPLTTYKFRVRASTLIEGLVEWGNYTDYVETQTLHGPPSNAPFGVFARPLSSSSIYVSWQPVNVDGSEVITKYDVQCIETETNEEIVVETRGDTNSITVMSLKPWRWYSIRVRAHNTQGSGEYSDSVQIRTFAGAPSAAPQNLRAFPMADEPHKLDISWEEVPPADQNGIIDGYFLQYWPSNQPMEASKTTNIPGGDQFEFVLTDLIGYTEYTLRILAYIIIDGQKSGGPFSQMVTAKTAQGLPGRVENLEITSGDNYLHLSWQEPAENVQNGIITGYNIKYYAVSDSEDTQEDSAMDGIPVGFSNSTHGHLMTSLLQYNLTGLVTDTVFTVSVTASTSVGTGLHPVMLNKSTGSLTLPPANPTDNTGGPSTPNARAGESSSGITGEWWTIPPKDMPVFIGAMVAIGLSILGIIIFGIYYCYRRKKKAEKRQSYLIAPSGKKSRKNRSSSVQSNDNYGAVELEESRAHYSKGSLTISESVAEREKADGHSSPRSDVAVRATIENDTSTSPNNNMKMDGASNQSVPMHVTRMDDQKEKSGKEHVNNKDKNSNANNMNKEAGPWKTLEVDYPMNDFGYSSLDEIRMKYLPESKDRNTGSASSSADINIPPSISENVTPREIPSPALSTGTNMSSLSATELDSLYSKVNFSMKKRNRKKRDSAAAIAAVLTREESGNIDFQDYDTNMSVILLSNEKTSL
ncbi:contactin-5-like isoform X2 [Ptychodera flava]|uniref:contactin-5-like isoform X2 n=1 Tax=Ptychodera flava TaxID=63121 RepID=UPI003969F738